MAQLVNASNIISTVATALADLGQRLDNKGEPQKEVRAPKKEVPPPKKEGEQLPVLEKVTQVMETIQRRKKRLEQAVSIEAAESTMSEPLHIAELPDWCGGTSVEQLRAITASHPQLLKLTTSKHYTKGMSVAKYAQVSQEAFTMIALLADFMRFTAMSQIEQTRTQHFTNVFTVELKPTNPSAPAAENAGEEEEGQDDATDDGVSDYDSEDLDLLSTVTSAYTTPADSAASSRASSPPPDLMGDD